MRVTSRPRGRRSRRPTCQTERKKRHGRRPERRSGGVEKRDGQAAGNRAAAREAVPQPASAEAMISCSRVAPSSVCLSVSATRPTARNVAGIYNAEIGCRPQPHAEIHSEPGVVVFQPLQSVRTNAVHREYREQQNQRERRGQPVATTPSSQPPEAPSRIVRTGRTGSGTPLSHTSFWLLVFMEENWDVMHLTHAAVSRTHSRGCRARGRMRPLKTCTRPQPSRPSHRRPGCDSPDASP